MLRSFQILSVKNLQNEMTNTVKNYPLRLLKHFKQQKLQ